MFPGSRSNTQSKRDKTPRVSVAVWISIAWLFIAGSRPVSLWVSGHLQDSTNQFLEGSPFDRRLLTTLIVAALVVLVQRQRRVLSILRGNIPLLIFIAYCGISILWSDYPDAAFKRWVRLLGDLTMILVVVTDDEPAAAIKAFVGRTGLILLPLSILMDFWRIATGRIYEKFMGLTTNKNMYGAIAMLLGTAAVWQLITTYRQRNRKSRFRRLLPHLCMAVMAIWCLSVAQSATSLACLFIGIALTLATEVFSFTSKPPVLHLVVGVLIFVALYASVLNPDVGLVSAVGKDPTLTGRTAVWQEVARLASSNPMLGAGFESFWMGPTLREMCSIFVWCPNEAHNGYLEVYANLGWVGIALLAGVIANGYRNIMHAIRMHSEVASLLLAYFVIVLIYNLSEAGFRIFSTPWLLFLLSLAAAIPLRKAAPRASLATHQFSAVQTIGIPARNRSHV